MAGTRKATTTVLHVVSTLESGGLERTLLALLARFREPTLRHVVVTLRQAGSLADRLPNHVPCVPLASRSRSLRTPCALARLIRNYSPAIVHARGIGCWFDATLATALTGRRVAVAMRGARVKTYASNGTPFRYSLMLGFHGWEKSEGLTLKHRMVARAALALNARFTSVSHAGAEWLHRQLAIPPARIHLLPNGVDLQRFSESTEDMRAETRAKLQVAADALVVTSVGSLTSMKRQDVLLAAASEVLPHCPGLVVLVVGDGRLRSQLEQQSAKLGMQSVVRFLGQREEIPAILAASDIYACTSDSEGMSNAILEALAAGLPIVATAVGDNSRLIRDRIEGLTIPPGAPAALAQAIRDLASDPALHRRMSAATRMRAADFSLHCCVARYEELYAGALHRESSPIAESAMPGRFDSINTKAPVPSAAWS